MRAWFVCFLVSWMCFCCVLLLLLYVCVCVLSCVFSAWLYKRIVVFVYLVINVYIAVFGIRCSLCPFVCMRSVLLFLFLCVYVWCVSLCSFLVNVFGGLVVVFLCIRAWRACFLVCFLICRIRG